MLFNPGCEKDPFKHHIGDTLDYGDTRVIPIEPKGISESFNYTVWVNGKKMFTGQAGSSYHGLYSFCSFDFEGTVTIRVRSNIIMYRVNILPSSLGIRYTCIDDHTIEFRLHEPEMITIQLNESYNKPLHILTSAPQPEIPDPDDNNVLYYEGPGIYDVDILELRSNQTLYIEAGAKLNGMILIRDVHNVKIMGRGMIDGSFNNYEGNHPEGDAPWRLIYMIRSEDIEIEGITLFNSPAWTIHAHSCTNLEIDNIRILNWNYLSDGTDISSCQDVRIANSFYRTNDDCIAIKALSFMENAFYPDSPVQNMNVHNILVEGCTLWNTDWGNVFEIGYELRCDTVSDITYRDCHAIRQGEHGAVFAVHNGDRAMVKNILYDNITVENAEAGATGEKLFDLAVFYTLFSYDSYWGDILPNGHWDNLLAPWGTWGSAQFRGHIRNITYRDIQLFQGGAPYSIFHGFDKDHKIENVTFDNIIFQGKEINSAEELELEVNDYVENIQFD